MFKGLKELYRKRMIMKIKKEEEHKRLCEINTRNNELAHVVNDMLIQKNKIKVIKATSEQEFEQKYNDFMETIKLDEKRRLGGIWSMENPKFTYEDGFLIYIIEYVELGLKDGVTEESYIKTIDEYDKSNLQYKSFNQEFHSKYD